MGDIDAAWPEDGELRACGHPDCYPRQFPVTYSDVYEIPDPEGSRS